MMVIIDINMSPIISNCNTVELYIDRDEDLGVNNVRARSFCNCFDLGVSFSIMN